MFSLIRKEVSGGGGGSCGRLLGPLIKLKHRPECCCLSRHVITAINFPMAVIIMNNEAFGIPTSLVKESVSVN